MGDEVIDVVSLGETKDLLAQILDSARAVLPPGVGFVVIVDDSRTIMCGGNMNRETTAEVLAAALGTFEGDEVPAPGSVSRA